MYGNMGGYSDAVGAALSGVGGEFGADLGGSYGAGFEGAMGGWGADRTGLAQSSEGSADARDESNDPTFNFTAGKELAPQIAQQQSFVNSLKAFMGLSPTLSIAKGVMSMMPEQMRAPTYGVMDLPGYQGLTDNLGYDPGLAQAFGAKSGVPYGFDEAMQNVPVVGSGAHLGLATNIANIGGQNVHMGPGFMMDENNYPGYGVNPVTGEGFADPSDPYIRRRRGTEIAGMI